MTGLRIGLIVLLAAWLGACQSDLDRRYLDTTLGQRLELPPDLVEPESEAGFDLPDVFYRGAADDGKGPPVLVNVRSIRLEGSGDLYWLRSADPVARLYPLLREFWAVEGYTLDMDEPAIGMLRTDWSFSEQGQESDSWLRRLFGGDEFAEAQDQFVTRLERDGEGGSRIFIAHRGTTSTFVEPEEGSPQDQLSLDIKRWVFRLSEPEREIEMLSRLMLFLGMEQAEADRQRARAALFAPRATIEFEGDDGAPLLRLKDSYQIAWNRVYHQIERMGYTITGSEFERGLDGRGNIVVEIELDEPEQETGGFFSWLGGNESRRRVHRLELVIAPEDERWTRVAIESSAGDLNARQRRDEFARLLHSQVR